MKSPANSYRTPDPLIHDSSPINPSKDYTNFGANDLSLSQSETSWFGKQLNFKFYFCYYCLLSICLGNSLAYYSVHGQSDNFLFLSIILIIGSIMFSLAIMILEVRFSSERLRRLFINTIVYLFVGFSIIFADPNIFSVLVRGHKEAESYAPSFAFLGILAVIGIDNLVRNAKEFLEINIILGSITLVLNMFGAQEQGKSIFQFILFMLLIVYLALNMKTVNKNYRLVPQPRQEVTVIMESPEPKIRTRNPEFRERTDVNRNSNTTIEEIVSFIVKSIELLSEVDALDPKSVESIQKSTFMLSTILEMLRTSPNVYQTNINNITKNLDEQDKIYIEQTFTEVNKSSSVHAPPLSKSNHKDPSYNAGYGVPELMGILRQIGNEWNFNTFFINECTKGAPLLCCGVYTIRRYGLDEIFSISDKALTSVLEALESKYFKNPYHNSCHAADVMCSYLYLIHTSSLVDEMSSLELIAGIFATLAHDVGHPAKNNRFLIMSSDDLAVQFNDISVLEMQHASIFFKILKTQEPNIFVNLQPEKWHQLRKLIIELILATDMGKHFEIMGYFNSKYLSISSELPDLSDPEFRLDQYKMAIKAADIGHAAKALDLHEKWCQLVIQEFFSQGEIEKSLGIPVSMYCDKDTTDISKSQSGFIKNIVLPLFSDLNKVMNSLKIEEQCICQLKVNEGY